MRSHHITRFTTVLIAGALGVAACGGSDEGSGAAETASNGVALTGSDLALAEALAVEWAAGETFPAELSADCLASGFVSGIGGAEGAERYGVDVSNVGNDSFDENPLQQGDALSAAGQMYKCDNFKSVFVSEISDVTDPDDLNCLSDAIADEPLTGLLASTFMGDEAGVLEELYENDFEADLVSGMTSCEIGA